MIGLAAGLTARRAGTPERTPTRPKRTSPKPITSPNKRALRPLRAVAGAGTGVSSRRPLLLQSAWPYSAGVRTGCRADIRCASSRGAVDDGIATGAWGCVASFRGAERTEAGATRSARRSTACLEPGRGTGTATVDARTARDRAFLPVTGGALRALLAGALLLDPAVTDDSGGAGAAGSGLGSAASGVRSGSRVSGSR